MKLALGIVLVLGGGIAALVFGFMGLMLGGGSLAQFAKAPPYFAKAAAASVAAAWGVWLLWQHASARKRPSPSEP